jgi:hypothetical protein
MASRLAGEVSVDSSRTRPSDPPAQRELTIREREKFTHDAGNLSGITIEQFEEKYAAKLAR